MTLPGTISLRIDINTAKDSKICDLIPFVRLERLQLLDSSTILDDAPTFIISDPITQSFSPHPVWTKERRDHKSKSLNLPSNHTTTSENNENIQTTPSQLSIRRSERRNQEPKTLKAQNVELSDDNQNSKNPVTKTSLQRKIETRGQDSRLSDRRNFKCSLCTERFHTRVLLAVHMRIHEKDSDEEDDEDEYGDEEDEEYVDDVRAFSKRELKSGEKSDGIKPVMSSASHSSSSKENKKLMPIIHDSSSAGDKNTICSADEDSESSLSSSLGPPNPRPKNKNLTKKRRGPIELLKCKECPASFSQQWYLDLHLILLHYVHKKNSSLKCPGCQTIFINEHHLRQHVETSHSTDLYKMNNEISSALALTTDALTGEHIKNPKKRGQNQMSDNLESSSQIKHSFQQMSNNLPSDWNKASNWEKDHIVELIEAELGYIAIERNKMGDHFSFSHMQRLSLEICDYLQISNFFNNNPPKRWAQRVIAKVRQVPRPGRFRFVHNVNASYLNAVSELSNRGLSENKIFYAFEARICDVKNDGTAKRVPKTPIGSTSPDASVEDTICTVLCTNANGSVLLHPTIVFRGEIADIKNLHRLKPVTNIHPSKDFLENAYFHEWFAQFLLAIPPARPILLLVEGTVSQLSFKIIMLARENDVHILFVPSRKRFVHSHQLIREALLEPLMREFDKEVVRHLEAHNILSLSLKDFGKVFEPAWKKALTGAATRKSFIQSGFLPLPNSTEPLEIAARDYLDEVIAVGKSTKSSSEVRGLTKPIKRSQVKPTSDASPLAASVDSDHCSVSSEISPSPTADVIKEEPLDCDSVEEIAHLSTLKKIKQEPLESNPCGATSVDIKQEVFDLPSSSQSGAEAELDVVKFDSEEQECPGCNIFFSSTNDLSTHQCSFKSARENSKEVSDTNRIQYHVCLHCMMSFELKDSLTYHINTCHASEASGSGIKMSQKKSTVDVAAIARQNSPKVMSTLKRKNMLEETSDSPKRTKGVHLNGATVSLACDSGTESTSSESSRTLTASPEPTTEHDYSIIGPRALPPPPLPEHDYLGQIYQKPKPFKPNKPYKPPKSLPTIPTIDKPVRFIRTVSKPNLQLPSPVQRIMNAIRNSKGKTISIRAISMS